MLSFGGKNQYFLSYTFHEKEMLRWKNIKQDNKLMMGKKWSIPDNSQSVLLKQDYLRKSFNLLPF